MENIEKDQENVSADVSQTLTEKSGRKKKILIIAVAAILILGTVAIVSVIINNKNAAKEQTTTTGEKDTNTEVTLAASPEIGSMEISPELTDDQIVDQIVANFNKVMTMRLVPESYDAYMSADVSGPAEWAKNCVQSDLKIFFIDMFGEDFESNSDLKLSYDALVDSASDILVNYIGTVAGNQNGAGLKSANLPTLQVSVAKNSYTKTNGYINITMTENTNYWETILAKSSTTDPATSPDDFTLVMNLGLDSKSNYITTTDSDGNKIIQFSSISVEQIN